MQIVVQHTLWIFSHWKFSSYYLHCMELNVQLPVPVWEKTFYSSHFDQNSWVTAMQSNGMNNSSDQLRSKK